MGGLGDGCEIRVFDAVRGEHEGVPGALAGFEGVDLSGSVVEVLGRAERHEGAVRAVVGLVGEEELGLLGAVFDLAVCGDLVGVVEEGVFLGAFEVLFVEEGVEGLVVFGSVFCLEGSEGEVGIHLVVWSVVVVAGG